MGIRCTATTAAGRACRAWAVRGSDPPRCRAHGGGTKDEGRGTDDWVSDELSADELAAQIEDLDARIERLGAYIDAHRAELAVGDLVRLLDLHSRMLGRVTQMRQAQNALHGEQSALMEAVREVIKVITDKDEDSA